MSALPQRATGGRRGLFAGAVMLDVEITKRLRQRKNGSMRKLARELDLPHSLVSDALTGRHNHIGRNAENRLRVALGLPPLPTAAMVFAVHQLPPGTLVSGHARQCELPGCGVWFVPASGRQCFCSPECRQSMQRSRNPNDEKSTP